jgi:hypothetical protein
VYQVKLEGVIVAGLGCPSDGIGNRIQHVVERGRLDDFALGLQLVIDLLAHRHFFVLISSLSR